VSAGERFQAFQRFCRNAPTLTDIDTNNLETVYCIAEALQEARIPTVELDTESVAIGDMIVAIRLWIWKIYQQCPLRNRRRKTKGQTYDRFFQIIKRLGINERLSVITTNYDLIYEYLSYAHGTPCYYPFDNLSATPGCLQIGSGMSPFVLLSQADCPGATPVYKLHGSVNFFEDDSAPGHPTFYVSTNQGDDTPIGKSHNYKGVPAIFAVDAIWDIRKKYGDGMVPAIVPPTYAKLTSKPWLVTLWNAALRAISDANRIAFIGYSLPESDGFIRALVHGALALRHGGGVPEVVVIDPCEAVHERFKGLFKTMYREIGTHTLGDCPTEELERIFS
jgi:hypothetical protein